MKILVSACLLGAACRYDGESRPHPEIDALAEKHELIPVCPEQLGGLPTPREPSEIKDGRAVTETGRDVTENYERGALEALKAAQKLNCRAAILKERSPSCGCAFVYDGTFTKTLVPGRGFTAALLEDSGIPVYGESQISSLFEKQQKNSG